MYQLKPSKGYEPLLIVPIKSTSVMGMVWRQRDEAPRKSGAGIEHNVWQVAAQFEP